MAIHVIIKEQLHFFFFFISIIIIQIRPLIKSIEYTIMSFTPAFDRLKSPSPDQTTLTQYLPRRSTGRINTGPDPIIHPHDDPLPPPAKPPPPSNPPQSMNHKKQPNYHKKKNRIHVGAYVYSRLGELHKVHPNQKRRVREKNMELLWKVCHQKNGLFILMTTQHIP